eukprot:786936-Rhodomonas_salina.2
MDRKKTRGYSTAAYDVPSEIEEADLSFLKRCCLHGHSLGSVLGIRRCHVLHCFVPGAVRCYAASYQDQ